MPLWHPVLLGTCLLLLKRISSCSFQMLKVLSASSEQGGKRAAYIFHLLIPSVTDSMFLIPWAFIQTSGTQSLSHVVFHFISQ